MQLREESEFLVIDDRAISIAKWCHVVISGFVNGQDFFVFCFSKKFSVSIFRLFIEIES